MYDSITFILPLQNRNDEKVWTTVESFFNANPPFGIEIIICCMENDDVFYGNVKKRMISLKNKYGKKTNVRISSQIVDFPVISEFSLLDYLKLDDETFISFILPGDIILPDSFKLLEAVVHCEENNWFTYQTLSFNPHSMEYDTGNAIFPNKFIESGLCDGLNWFKIDLFNTAFKYEYWKKISGELNSEQKVWNWDFWRKLVTETLHVSLEQPILVRDTLNALVSDRTERTKKLDKILPLEKRKECMHGFIAHFDELTFKTFVVTKDSVSIKDLPLELKSCPTWIVNDKKKASKEIKEDEEELSAILIKQLLGELDKCLNKSTNQITEKRKPAINLNLLLKRSYLKLTAMDLERISVIRKSNLFNYSYYLSQFNKLEMDPLLYYYTTFKGDPNPFFDSKWYLNTYKEVQEMKINPLFHYIMWGTSNGYNPHPDFSTNDYFAKHPGVKIIGINPLEHFIHYAVPVK